MENFDCALCGKPTDGKARIDDNYYCHTGQGATCYVRASWVDRLTLVSEEDFEFLDTLEVNVSERFREYVIRIAEEQKEEK